MTGRLIAPRISRETRNFSKSLCNISHGSDELLSENFDGLRKTLLRADRHNVWVRRAKQVFGYIFRVR